MRTTSLIPAKELERHENARKAIAQARKLHKGWQTLARMLTRDNTVKVELHGGATSCTDGKTIFIRVPMELADLGEHDRSVCGQRHPDTLILLCDACAILEDVNITVIHEVAHIAFETFQQVDNYEATQLLANAIRTECEGNPNSKRAQIIKARIDQADPRKKSDYLNLADIVSAYLPPLINACEDIRVNAMMRADRPGTKVMFEAQTNRVFMQGVKQYDGTYATWDEAKPNAQALIGVYCLTGEIPIRGKINDDIVDRLESSAELMKLCEQMRQTKSVRDVYKLSYPLLEELRRLGFCRLPDEPEDEPEPQPEPEPESKENDESGDSQDQGEQGEPGMGSGDSGDESQAGGDPGESDDSSAGEASDDSDATEDNSDSEGTNSEGPGDSGQPDNDSEESSMDGEQAGSSDGPGDSDESGNSEQVSGTNSEPETDGGESSEDDAGDGSSNTDREDTESSNLDSGGDPQERDSDSSGESNSSDNEEGSVSNSEVNSDDSTTEKAGESASETIQEASDGTSSGDSDRSDSATSERSEGTGDDHSEHDRGESADSTDEPVDQPDTPQDGPGMPEDGSDGSDQPDSQDGPYGAPKDSAEPPDPERDGTPEDVEELLQIFGRHEPKTATPSERHEERANEEAVDISLSQMDHFDAPSLRINGINFHEHDKKGLWEENRFNQLGPRGRPGIEVPEKIVQGSLQRLRMAFVENRRGKKESNLRYGRIDAKSLARKVPTGDDRIFRHKIQPGKRDYFVVIGIDCSGSTAAHIDRNIIRLDLMKAAVAAKAEMLSRLGIPFAVYAHSGSHAAVDIFVIKSDREPWGRPQKQCLAQLEPYSANLDGHTLEFYRKVAERRTETDKIILYYTDGAMPLANKAEELEILLREIDLCKKLDIKLVGIGVNSDAPKEHGLDTILLDELSDVPKVVVELGKRINP